MMRLSSTLSCIVLLLAACGRGEPARTDSAAPAAPATPATPATTAARDTSRPTVTPEGVGPVRIGMTASAVRAALRLPDKPMGASENECNYLDASALAPKLKLMLERDTVVRIDVHDTTLATAAGARVGDTEAHVQSLYGARLRVEPHKYTGPTGHYLVVVPGTDSARRIIFETDGQHVTMYRAGRMPAVAYVEGCS